MADRVWRATWPVDGARLGLLPESRSPYHEEPEDIAALLSYGEAKAALIEWIDWTAADRCTTKEQEAIHMLYRLGLSLPSAARLARRNPSTIWRARDRAIRKLRAAAKQSPPPAAALATFHARGYRL